jgi:hypothetical protein
MRRFYWGGFATQRGASPLTKKSVSGRLRD